RPGARPRMLRPRPPMRRCLQLRRPPMRNPRNEPLADQDIEGTRRAGDGPERRCVLSGRIGGRDEFVRLALSLEGVVLPDALAKAPGRGAWIGVDEAELGDAVASGKLKAALSRAFKVGQLPFSKTFPNSRGTPCCARCSTGWGSKCARESLSWARIGSRTKPGWAKLRRFIMPP